MMFHAIDFTDKVFPAMPECWPELLRKSAEASMKRHMRDKNIRSADVRGILYQTGTYDQKPFAQLTVFIADADGRCPELDSLTETRP